jgi:hypothetical protein
VLGCARRFCAQPCTENALASRETSGRCVENLKTVNGKVDWYASCYETRWQIAHCFGVLLRRRRKTAWLWRYVPRISRGSVRVAVTTFTAGNGEKLYSRGALKHPAGRFFGTLGPKVYLWRLQMELAQQVRLASKADAPSRDMSIILGYSIFALVILLAIYLAAGGPGTAEADFANMVVFP